MTRDELENLIYERTRYFVDVPVADCIFDLIAAEREKVAAWMRSKSYATGHGDTTEDLLKELEWQVAEREREACAKVCEENQFREIEDYSCEPYNAGCRSSATAIRARGEV